MPGTVYPVVSPVFTTRSSLLLCRISSGIVYSTAWAEYLESCYIYGEAGWAAGRLCVQIIQYGPSLSFCFLFCWESSSTSFHHHRSFPKMLGTFNAASLTRRQKSYSSTCQYEHKKAYALWISVCMLDGSVWTVVCGLWTNPWTSPLWTHPRYIQNPTFQLPPHLSCASQPSYPALALSSY